MDSKQTGAGGDGPLGSQSSQWQSQGADDRWERVESMQDFTQVVALRRRVTVTALGVFVLWFGAFLVLSAFAKHLMATSIYRGFTVALAFALSLILMTWLIAWLYARSANRSVEPLIERIRGADPDSEQTTDGR